MEEIPKLNSVEPVSLGTQKIAVSDQEETSLEEAGISDSFIVDIEKLSHGTIDDNNISASSRISVKLQRNLSRKGSRERNKATLGCTGASDASSNGGSDPEKSPLAPKSSGLKDPINKQPQQTITITAENSSSRKCLKPKTSSFGPRRVLLLSATLSSMGTILLIYFTLSMGKFSGDNSTQAQ